MFNISQSLSRIQSLNSQTKAVSGISGIRSNTKVYLPDYSEMSEHSDRSDLPNCNNFRIFIIFTDVKR